MNIQSNENLFDYINRTIYGCNISFMQFMPHDCNLSEIEITQLGDDDTITTLDEFGNTTYRRYVNSMVRTGLKSDCDYLDKVFTVLTRLRERDIKLVSRPFSLEGLKAITAEEVLKWETGVKYLEDTILL